MGAVAFDLDNVHEPTPEEIRAAGQAARALASAREPHIKVAEQGHEAETLQLPSALFKTIIRVLAEIGNGNTIAVIPVQAELTTQQAADLLNVSRPHLIKLLKQEAIPYHMAGTHRRLRARDVLNYKSKIDHRREAALNAIAEMDERLGLYDDEKVGEDA